MAVIASIQDIYDKIAAGKAVTMEQYSITSGSTTTATAASGGMTFIPMFNSIGTTLYSTLQGGVLPPGLVSPTRLVMARAATGRAAAHLLVYLYKLGTLNMAATGDQFTHDAATFPVLRTVQGQASQPLVLDPLLLVTTATTTTAPIMTIKNAGATTGYKNQAGTTIVGTKTLTLPATATAVGSTFHFRLEDVANSGAVNDVGVQDITSINIGTAGATGAADVYGMEVLANVSCLVTTIPSGKDAVTRSFVLPDITPAVATSGTAVAKLAIVSVGTASTNTSHYQLIAVQDS